MCGIAGFTGRDEKLIHRMTDAIAHRGPDQSGHFVDDHVSLGHRRLSIIDLTEDGRQPMSNEDGTIQIVFNGEIYNHLELRPELERLGHTFKSRSDTEVIIHAYEQHGLDAIHKLRGMFAFAIWDSRRQLLWIARDRIGIKPVYYRMAGGRLIFASEIKAILQDPSVPRELNRQSLFDYLGYEFVPAPETMFADIHKLPAGHQLVWQNGQAKVSQYWDLSFKQRQLAGKTVDDLAIEVRDLLDQCVKSHLMSDVPLGVFLSGGLDSSALVALMRRHIPGQLRTFTIGYPDKSFSELDYAKVVADHLGTDHHVLMIEGITEDDIETSLYHFDEPMTDLSSIPLMKICGEARKQITVCLSGEGGDEVFAGYDRFKASKMNRMYSWLPKPVRDPLIAKLVSLLPDQAQKKGAFNVIKRFIEGSCLPTEGEHLRWQYFLHEHMIDPLFQAPFRNAVRMDPFRLVRAHAEKFDGGRDVLNRELYLDTRFEMADSVLMKVDKMSMRHSLEVRVPLLDHVFVEMNAALPGDMKLKGFQTKHLFRKALEGLLPHDIVYRGKQGYSLPVKNLLRVQLKDYMRTLLNESKVIRENMNVGYVNTLIDEHLAQKHNHNHVLWGMITVAIWHRRFIESAPAGN